MFLPDVKPALKLLWRVPGSSINFLCTPRDAEMPSSLQVQDVTTYVPGLAGPSTPPIHPTSQFQTPDRCLGFVTITQPLPLSQPSPICPLNSATRGLACMQKDGCVQPISAASFSNPGDQQVPINSAWGRKLPFCPRGSGTVPNKKAHSAAQGLGAGWWLWRAVVSNNMKVCVSLTMAIPSGRQLCWGQWFVGRWSTLQLS